MTTAPVICLTMRGRPFEEKRTSPTPYAYEWLPNSYGAAITRAGGVPVFLSNESNPDAVREILRRVDGLFLTGGEDVDPAHYGERDEVGNVEVYAERDRVELAAVAVADELGLPILGVCRGVQVLNVARGGTLYQDLDKQLDGAPRDHSRGGTGMFVQTHEVEVTPGCRLEHLLGTRRLQGATSHHQAVKTPGRDLVAVAHSPEDGIIEAVEQPGERFVVGVQWHPEVRAEDATTQRLFRSFVEAASAYRKRQL